MPYCPSCGAEVGETDNFCRRCGARLKELEYPPGTPEAAVKSVIIGRIEGIKRRDPEAISNLVDRERYTKFDDWPPYELQGPEALEREAEALRVLKEYTYETMNWKINILGDAALAAFTIRYRGTIRDRDFDLRSRVTAVLAKSGDVWRIVHEHWSRSPEMQGPRGETLGRRRFKW
ncbi:MAG: zinc-ribbon domain-containing protein [Candidatus Bathyarchaeia archaeon]|nr:zinc ribbon domain-containing protein [Candidatus Bathyarchaeota archaeon]